MTCSGPAGCASTATAATGAGARCRQRHGLHVQDRPAAEQADAHLDPDLVRGLGRVGGRRQAGRDEGGVQPELAANSWAWEVVPAPQHSCKATTSESASRRHSSNAGWPSRQAGPNRHRTFHVATRPRDVRPDMRSLPQPAPAVAPPGLPRPRLHHPGTDGDSGRVLLHAAAAAFLLRRESDAVVPDHQGTVAQARGGG